MSARFWLEGTCSPVSSRIFLWQIFGSGHVLETLMQWSKKTTKIPLIFAVGFRCFYWGIAVSFHNSLHNLPHKEGLHVSCRVLSRFQIDILRFAIQRWMGSRNWFWQNLPSKKQATRWILGAFGLPLRPVQAMQASWNVPGAGKKDSKVLINMRFEKVEDHDAFGVLFSRRFWIEAASP